MISTKKIFFLLVTISLHLHYAELTPVAPSTISTSDELSTEIPAEKPPIDVNSTIEEVTRLLEKDPNLPRLTRGEILELLENITNSDNEAEQNGTRQDHQRAIMYVMPYSPKNFSDIQELYTKPPVTHLVGKEGDEKTTQRPTIRTRLPPVHKMQLKQQNKVHIRVNAESGLQLPPTNKPTVHNSYKNVAPKVESVKVPSIRIPDENIKVSFQPAKLPNTSDKYKNEIKGKPVESTTKLNPNNVYITKAADVPVKIYASRPTTTKRPQNHRGAIRYPNHKYPEDVEIVSTTHAPHQAMKIVEAPHLSQNTLTKPLAENPLNADYWHHNKYKPGTVLTEDITKVKIPSPASHRRRPYPQKDPHYNSYPSASEKPTPPSPSPFKITTTTIASPPPQPLDNFDFGIPDQFKEMIQNIDLSAAETKKNTAGKYSSTYASSDLPVQKVSSPAPPMKESVKEILASIGLFPQADLTTTTPKPDLSVGAEGLDPEMRELLMTFGLIPNPKEAHTLPPNEDYTEPAKPSLSAASYSGFKPLPDTAPSRGDMESFLSQFGLGGSQRAQKAVDLKTPNVENPDMKRLTSLPNFDEDMIPEGMKDVLEDIGLTSSRRDRRIQSSSSAPKTHHTKQHVFNPESAYATNEELKKLELLLTTIKQLEKLNGTISQADLDALDLANIKELTDSLNNSTVKNIPLDQQEDDELNPVSLEELQHLFKVKPEFKRQNNETGGGANVTVTVVEEPRNPPLSELAASFPGTTDTEGSLVVPDEALPPPRRNGFYFLLDWNSFLEVGEEGKNKVNIRLAPKVGDPSRFIEVKVP